MLLQARFIMITIFYIRFFKQTLYAIRNNTNGTEISLMKFIRFVTKNLVNFISLFNRGLEHNKLSEQIKKYCTYDKRKRKNYTQIFWEVIN